MCIIMYFVLTKIKTKNKTYPIFFFFACIKNRCGIRILILTCLILHSVYCALQVYVEQELCRKITAINIRISYFAPEDSRDIPSHYDKVVFVYMIIK